jgi:hypothetical protein
MPYYLSAGKRNRLRQESPPASLEIAENAEGQKLVTDERRWAQMKSVTRKICAHLRLSVAKFPHYLLGGEYSGSGKEARFKAAGNQRISRCVDHGGFRPRGKTRGGIFCCNNDGLGKLGGSGGLLIR